VSNIVSIQDLRTQLLISFATNTTTIIEGQPGTGKTQVSRAIALEHLRSKGLNEDHYQYILAPTKTAEFAGGVMMPVDKVSRLMIPEWITRLEPGMVVHLDELDKVHVREQMIYLQLLHEGGIDGFQLPPIHWIVTCNRAQDRGGSFGANVLLGNRARVVEFLPKPQEVLDYMIRSDFHPWIIAFLAQNQGRINEYDATRLRNNTSRSWEAASSALKALEQITPNPSPSLVVQTVAASVPDNIAVEFKLYSEVAHQLTSWDAVMKDPDNAPLPSSDNDAATLGLMWMQAAMVATTATKYGKMTGVKAWTYLKRLPAEYRASFEHLFYGNLALIESGGEVMEAVSRRRSMLQDADKPRAKVA
jgi:hypothetical protein